MYWHPLRFVYPQLPPQEGHWRVMIPPEALSVAKSRLNLPRPPQRLEVLGHFASFAMRLNSITHTHGLASHEPGP